MSNAPTAHGYIEDAVYPSTYFRELSPVWLNYVAALGGAAPRRLDTAFTYLELGCGFAHSTLVHAAAYPSGCFYACDFNGTCITAARRRAQAFAIRNLQLLESSFDALSRAELPHFDFIVLHGVYSWVSAQVRRSIRRLIRDRLAPGGLVYLSYNCLPGWAGEAPLRKLLIELAASSRGDTIDRIEHAVQELVLLGNGGLRFLQAHPGLRSVIDTYTRSPRGYLAHEFLGEAWEPQYSVDVADEMVDAGLSYLGSATLTNNHDELMVDAPIGGAIARLETARQRQLAMDFAVDRQFRRDVFVNGANTQRCGVETLGKVVVGSVDVARIGTTLHLPRGAISFGENFIRALQAAMSRGSSGLWELTAELGRTRGSHQHILRNLLYLIAGGALTPFVSPFRVPATRSGLRFSGETVKRMFDVVAAGNGRSWIASEIVGHGIALEPSEAAAVIDIVTGRQCDRPSELVERMLRVGLLVE